MTEIPSPKPAPGLPQFIRAEVERAIAMAVNPPGMSMHDGKALIGHDKLRYMLALIDKLSATQAPAVGADDARDAKRYRWLKSLPGASPRLRGMAIDGAATLKNNFRAPHAVCVAVSIDAAIDAAMGEVKPPVQHKEPQP